jgi:hypothetical protein
VFALIVFAVFAVILSGLWYSFALDADLRARRAVEDARARAFADFSLALYGAVQPNLADGDLSDESAVATQTPKEPAFRSRYLAYNVSAQEVAAAGVGNTPASADTNTALRGGKIIYDETAGNLYSEVEDCTTASVTRDHVHSVRAMERLLFGLSQNAGCSGAQLADAGYKVTVVSGAASIAASTGNAAGAPNREAGLLAQIRASAAGDVLPARQRLAGGVALRNDGLRLRAWLGCANQSSIDSFQDGTISLANYETDSCSHVNPDDPMMLIVWAENASGGGNRIAGLYEKGPIRAALKRVFPSSLRNYVGFGAITASGAGTTMDPYVYKIGKRVLPDQKNLNDALNGNGSQLAFYAVTPVQDVPSSLLASRDEDVIPGSGGEFYPVDGVTTANAVGTNQGADEFFTSNCDGTTLTHGYRFKSEDDAKTLNFCYALPTRGFGQTANVSP